MKVEVAYALPEKQSLLSLDVEEGTTALDAVKASGIDEIYPEINLDDEHLSDLKLGIFSMICAHDKILKEKDRVEIYRPLLIDPKESRKNRAALAKAQAKNKLTSGNRGE